jgi:hypothetical protein
MTVETLRGAPSDVRPSDADDDVIVPLKDNYQIAGTRQKSATNSKSFTISL